MYVLKLELQIGCRTFGVVLGIETLLCNIRAVFEVTFFQNFKNCIFRIRGAEFVFQLLFGHFI